MSTSYNNDNNYDNYDYVIIGAGPTGLTLGWLLAQERTVNRILVLERAETIGGCHRVDRDPTLNLFTEHGPRIYSTIFLNVIQILEKMGISFEKLFTPYKFTHGSMSQEVLSKLTFTEILKLGIEYIKLVFDPAYGLFTTVATFLEINDFTKISKDLIGKMCHLTDGAGPERFTMNQFLHAFDHHVFYTFMQPKLPNDVGLFPLWKEKLLQTGKIDIWLNSDVKNIESNNCGNSIGNSANNNNDNKIVVTLLKMDQYGGKQLTVVTGSNVVLAIPPEHALRISGLENWTTKGRVFSSNPNLIVSDSAAANSNNLSSRGNLNNRSNLVRSIVDKDRLISINTAEFGRLARYDYYLPIVFHYPFTRKELSLPIIWGFPETDWGVITIVLSDYMDFNDARSKLVISTCISLTNSVSKKTGLTANQTQSTDALLEEVYRQINIVYKGKLPRPYNLSLFSRGKNPELLQNGIMILSPHVSFDTKRQIWVNSDSSFINTPRSGHLPNWENAAIPGLYWVGSLNGQSYYNFSSMESAVSNAISFYLSKYENKDYVVRSPINFSTILRFSILIIIIILIFKTKAF